MLFVGLRMRALQITDNKGAPQGYAQQGMFLASFAVMAQLVLCLMLPCVLGETEKDEDGSPVVKGAGAAAYALVAFKWLALAALYGGAITVAYAVFDITPTNATGK